MKSVSMWILVGLVALLACSPKSGVTIEHLAEQSGSGGCPAAPKIVVGTVAVGGSCMTAADCAPICCTCTTGIGQWLGAECRNDTCDTADACADSASPTYCQ
jgi:hypothetical protein